MKSTVEQIRAYRLAAHHLHAKGSMDGMLDAAGACGLQNTPPGAWETAMHNRLEGCTLHALQEALYREKTLVQAWGIRGVPVVFPAEQNDVFLTPLIAREGEQPWIYTQGITGALDHLQMSFDDLLARLKKAIGYLDHHTIQSKETLDQTLADRMRVDLPKEKQPLWDDPSMYGNPEKQTVGGAVVSFLLRPCSFYSLVVFGQRQGSSPTFTSFQNWMGRAPIHIPDAEKKLVRKYLHCYGPSTVDAFTRWLGCSPGQARRLWHTVSDEITPVRVEEKLHYILTEDVDALRSSETDTGRLLLLGAHDPFLDLRDRTVILDETRRHQTVWRFVANPGVVLRGGRIIGIWKSQTVRDQMDLSATLWEAVSPGERQTISRLAEEYAAFRILRVRNCTIEGE